MLSESVEVVLHSQPIYSVSTKSFHPIYHRIFIKKTNASLNEQSSTPVSVTRGDQRLPSGPGGEWPSSWSSVTPKPGGQAQAPLGEWPLMPANSQLVWVGEDWLTETILRAK